MGRFRQSGAESAGGNDGSGPAAGGEAAGASALPVLSADRVIERLLRAVREHLDLDVAFVGEVRERERVFRYVDAKPGIDAVAAGGSDPLEQTYCSRVLDGSLPQFLADPKQHPVAARLPVTGELPVGTHLSVPIEFSDGRTYGTFCCFSTEVEPSLEPADLSSLRVIADLVAEYLEAVDAVEADRARRRRSLEEAIGSVGLPALVFQPLWDLEAREIVAVEALSRFPGQEHGPEWFFAEASELGLGIELEMRPVVMALAAFEQLPASIRLNVNVSPATVCSPGFFEAIAAAPADRLVVEVTEHAAIDDYGELQATSARLAASGVRLAIDDVGMGFSGLNRILQSSPQELKLDAVVVRDVDSNPIKQALIESFCSFGRRAGLDIVAEGVETAAELEALRALGVKLAQGYHLGRPQPLETVPWSARGNGGAGVR